MVSPELISQLELLGFIGELLLDVFGVEDVLEVHPLPLEGEPLVEDVRDVAEPLFPLLHLVPDLVHVLRPHHGLDRHGVVFQLRYHIIYFGDDEPVLGVSVVHHHEPRLLPQRNDVVQRRLYRRLPRSLCRDFFDFFVVGVDALLDEVVEVELADVGGLVLLRKQGKDLLPVPLLHVFVPQRHYQVPMRSNLLHLGSQLLQNLIFVVSREVCFEDEALFFVVFD
mmetsp:Transcript_9244/g.8682  ORF Transcript_9244/g.8682 Transcript_9244/m.8682 type:complete len:224 (+) Transcript_9244:1872-2543(+)